MSGDWFEVIACGRSFSNQPRDFYRMADWMQRKNNPNMIYYFRWTVMANLRSTKSMAPTWITLLRPVRAKVISFEVEGGRTVKLILERLIYICFLLSACSVRFQGLYHICLISSLFHFMKENLKHFMFFRHSSQFPRSRTTNHH